MLVVLSDLHFEEEAANQIMGDGSQPPLVFHRNLPAQPYRLLIAQLAGEAKAKWGAAAGSGAGGGYFRFTPYGLVVQGKWQRPTAIC